VCRSATLADSDLIELNEAFAVQVLAVTRQWGFTDEDWERTNVNGSGISLGHPVGATRARILATGARQLHRDADRYLLETMCIAGGPVTRDRRACLRMRIGLLFS